MIRQLTILFGLALCAISSYAQTDSARVYTEQQPLVYEDSWNYWPFAFLNDQGEPEGYNIGLVRMLMEELGVPYVIRLKPQMEVLEDLKAGKCDLTLGPASIFHEDYGLYGRSAVMLLTQSVATPKGRPVAIRTFRDLSDSTLQVTVSDSSICHHLMVDYGWASRAVVSSDMSAAIRQLNDKGEGQIVWNTLSLRWLMQHHHLENLELTPVNMPYGENRFMARDRRLLDRIDKAYARLCADDKLMALERQWLYPADKGYLQSLRAWLLAGGALLLLALALFFFVQQARKARRLAAGVRQSGSQLAEIAHDNKVRFWIYHVQRSAFTWYDGSGKAVGTYTMEDFARRYDKDDFARLKAMFDRLASQQPQTLGHKEEDMLELRAMDAESGDGKLHDFVIVLSVLSRDSSGRPTRIIGTKKDVTEERRLKQHNNEQALRFWSMFYNDLSGVFLTDKDGYIKNVNLKACELYGLEADEIVKRHVHVNKFFQTAFADLRDADGWQGTMAVDEHIIKYHMKTFCNDRQELLGLFVFCL